MWGLFCYGMGFPKRIAASEYLLMAHRAGCIDFEGHGARLRALSQSGVPFLLFFGDKDALFEKEIHDEVAALWPSEISTCFESGSHYTIKSHAKDIGQAVASWAKAQHGGEAGRRRKE